MLFYQRGNVTSGSKVIEHKKYRVTLSSDHCATSRRCRTTTPTSLARAVVLSYFLQRHSGEREDVLKLRKRSSEEAALDAGHVQRALCQLLAAQRQTILIASRLSRYLIHTTVNYLLPIITPKDHGRCSIDKISFYRLPLNPKRK